MSKSSIHIAVVIGSMEMGGAERATLNLVNSLGRKGAKVDLVLQKKSGAFLSMVDPSVNIIALETKRARDSVFAARDYLNKVNPDIVFAVQNHIQLMILIAIKLSNWNGKIVLNEQSTLSKNLKGLKGKFQLALSKMLFGMSDSITAVSTGSANDLQRIFPKLSSRICVIPNPIVSQKVFELMNEKPDHIFFKERCKVIVSAGRLTASKNFSLLINAFAELRKNENLKLIILGDGEEKNILLRLIENLGMVNDISLPGYVENPYSFYRNAEVFVLSSDYEGLPGVIIEGLACGCKIVSTDCESGPSEILLNGKLGTLVPVNDLNRLTVAIKNALINSADKKIALERAMYFHEEVVSDHYIKLFNSL